MVWDEKLKYQLHMIEHTSFGKHFHIIIRLLGSIIT